MARPSTTTRNDWLAAAIRAFRSGGRGAVRVDVLARTMGISRGSFYHHFRDRADLMDGILEAWERETDSAIAQARAAATPEERLRAFFRQAQAMEDSYPPDVEVLAWAREDPEVARLARRVERRRVRFIREQLEDAGLAPAEAKRRADIAYLATQGWVMQAGYGARPRGSRAPFTADLFKLLLEL